MDYGMLLVFFLAYLPGILTREIEDANLVINGTASVAQTDAHFICATIDWWPRDKCDYNQCPWGSSSILNLERFVSSFISQGYQRFVPRDLRLKDPEYSRCLDFQLDITAFEPLRLRVGGSLQDRVLYNVGNLDSPCHPFTKVQGGLFGFSKGCLQMSRWDELNHLFMKTGALVTFGLNALHGRHQIRRGVWGGNWNSSNAHDFIKYTVSKGYPIDSWEFGNELSGKGIGASVGAKEYGNDLVNLKGIIDGLYKDFHPKPLLLAPGGFYDSEWYAKILQVSGSRVVDVLTHHIYNLGPGRDPNLMKKILDPFHLSKISATFSSLKENIQVNGPWASAWVGESGGAFNSGGHHVSDTFVNSFWYLDQLGMAAKYDTKVYCRQTLIGGNYGLLDRTTFIANPDYYSALLWHQLMGREVLAVDSNSSPYLRSYVHCSKGRAGITLLLINLSNQTHFQTNVQTSTIMYEKQKTTKRKSFVQHLKKAVSWVGSSSSDISLFREEYHLTGKDRDLQSKTMLLNGVPLELTDDGDIPRLVPVWVDLHSPISISPLSIKFIVFPNFDAPGCH